MIKNVKCVIRRESLNLVVREGFLKEMTHNPKGWVEVIQIKRERKSVLVRGNNKKCWKN